MSSRRLAPRQERALRSYLDEAHARLHTPELIASDPLCLALERPPGAERELAGLLAAWLASGRAAAIIDGGRHLLDRLGPLAELRGLPARALEERISGFRYRWVGPKALAAALAALLDGQRSPMAALEAHDDAKHPSLAPALGAWVGDLEARAIRELQGLGGAEADLRSLRWLLANPARGGTAKRWWMWLRWFVRQDAVDPGGWSRLGAWRLQMPVDTHVFRITRFLGLHRRATPNAAAAAEITAAFARLSPEDPLRWDFTLARIGIVGHCPGKRRAGPCDPCALRPVCRAGR